MSGVERILAELADGEWHTSHDLYWKCGPLILHSRIADARKQGHTIEGRHVPGNTGTYGYEYRLLSAGGAASDSPPDGVNAPCAELPVSPRVPLDGQLSLA